MHVASRFLAALCLLAAAPAAATTITPTFQFAWGAHGTGPGQFFNPSSATTDAQGNLIVVDSGTGRVQKFNRYGNYLFEFGGPGTGNGQFLIPFGIATDVAGNLYVSEFTGNRVQKFTSNGTYVMQFGSPGSGNGQFDQPRGIAVDNAGNIYVVDGLNQRVQKFDASGNFLLKWGSLGSGNGQFNGPRGIAIDRFGYVYVGDLANNRVQKFTSNGVWVASIGQYGFGNGEFNAPSQVAVDAVGNLFVSDEVLPRVQMFSSSGAYLTQWGSNGSGDGQFGGYTGGIAVDGAGNIYVLDPNNKRVQKWSGAGASLTHNPMSVLLSFGGSGSSLGQFQFARGVAVDGSNNVFVGDITLDRITKFNPNGTPILQWGSAGSGNGQFAAIAGIACDASGNVFVADYTNAKVQKFSSTGAFITSWGSIGSGNGQFTGLNHIATDPAGNVYTTEEGTHRVQKFSNSGAYLAQWGGFGSTDGLFNAAVRLTVDATGMVYVVDAGNSRIQRFTSNGTFIGKWGSAGSGPGQFNGLGTITTDAVGNVYVADFQRIQKFTSNGTFLAQTSTLVNGADIGPFDLATDAAGNLYGPVNAGIWVYKYAATPEIAQISDVGNDQGRQVRLRIQRASADAAGSGATITGYAVYRRVEAGAMAARSAPAAEAAGIETIALSGWDYLGTQPAAGDAEYSMVVPTLADANNSLTFSTFLVRALTPTPTTFYTSTNEAGYSIDNLSPLTPSPFTGTYAASATHLHWGLSAASDFATFRLYRGASSDFAPSPSNLVISTTDTDYNDAGAAGSWYKLSAVDLNGNESAFASLGPNQTTGVDDPDPAIAFALDPVHPNPVRGRSIAVHFALPSGGKAQLQLIDVMGRVVASREVGHMGAGRHVVDLSAGRRLTSGVYMVRLSTAASARVARITIMD